MTKTAQCIRAVPERFSTSHVRFLARGDKVSNLLFGALDRWHIASSAPQKSSETQLHEAILQFAKYFFLGPSSFAPAVPALYCHFTIPETDMKCCLKFAALLRPHLTTHTSVLCSPDRL